MNDLHSDWWGGMGIGMTVFWLIVIAVIFILIKQGVDGASSRSGNISESPLNVLKKRYAAGEIDKDKFESMKKELEK
jgi:putative membrane protein